MGDQKPGQQVPASEDQVCNSAGGYVWPVSDMNRLRRFMVLGTEGGTYYIQSKDLGLENIDCIQKLIDDGLGEEVVKEIVKFSVEGRAAKQNPIMLALVQCARCTDMKTKKAAYDALSKVCRIPTHLFQFIEYSEKFSEGTGWGRAQRRAISRWYNNKKPNDLAYQITKYRKRNGWTHRDVLRLAHVKPENDATSLVLKYIAKGKKALLEEFGKIEEPNDRQKSVMMLLRAVEDAKVSDDQTEIMTLIEEHNLVREHIPTKFLKEKDIWRSLLQQMPMTAMIRNLGKMSSIELLAPLSDEANLVCERLQSDERLKKARIHPFSILLAYKTYKAKKGDKGKLTWEPEQTVLNALDDAFYKSFKFVEPTGKRFLLAVDVSGSMSCSGVNGARNVTAREAAAAMTMVTMRTEKRHHLVAFSNRLVDIPINEKMRMDEVIRICSNIPMGATDCAQPMIYARQKKISVDVFIIYTDCETWAGNIQPAEALRSYRKETGIDAKLIVVAMTSNGFTLADPKDAGMMDIVGFDAAAPDVIRNFALGLL
ncbi:RNA-binding protein RO60-like isoform X2 [Amphiura filiformis]